MRPILASVLAAAVLASPAATASILDELGRGLMRGVDVMDVWLLDDNPRPDPDEASTRLNLATDNVTSRDGAIITLGFSCKHLAGHGILSIGWSDPFDRSARPLVEMALDGGDWLPMKGRSIFDTLMVVQASPVEARRIAAAGQARFRTRDPSGAPVVATVTGPDGAHAFDRFAARCRKRGFAVPDPSVATR